MKITTLLATLLVATMSFAQVPAYVPTNGLVGWYPFNGNANDESGNGNNGTVNGATLTSDRFGNANSSYSFDGIDDFIEIPNSSSLSNPNLTIGFWINTNSVVYQQVLYKVSFNTAQNEEYSIPLNLNNQNEINLDLKNNSCSPGIGWVYFNNSAVLSNWKHVIFTHDGSITRFFLDGILINSQNANFNIANCPGGSLILGIAWNLQHAFNGALDDIGIWNRALSECEIQDLYHSQLGSNNSSSSQTQTALDTYTWPVNNQTYTQTGTYSDTLVNAAGCDSIVTLNLTLNYTGIHELNQSKLVISPNPTKDIFTITGLEQLGTTTSLELKDANGKVVKVLDPKTTEFKITDLKAGIYFLEITAGTTHEVIKLVKE